MTSKHKPTGKSVLVIGANRGIGLALLKVFKAHGWEIHGTVRPSSRCDPSFKDLQDTGATIFDLDYLDEASILSAAAAYGPEKPLDVLVNCGGLPVDPEGWLEHSGDCVVEKLRVMAVGPFMAMQQFLPSLRRSELGKVANITSLWASIEWNDMGKFIGYRTAKSALNSLSVSAALELKAADERIAVLCLDPGYVPTRLSKFKGNVRLEESVNGLFHQIQRATMEDSGTFVSWAGKTRPW